MRRPQRLAANVLEGGIIQVIDKRDLARADSTVPVETRLVRVNYARAGALMPSVQSLLTKRGAVVADSTTNALVITEVTTRINRVEEFVKGLDIRTPQVSIQATLIFSTALGNFDLTTFLQALQRVELADIQAEPTITTLDNLPAEILVGDRVPIRVIDVSAGTGGTAPPRATVRFEQTGINLRVTPHVTANRQVLMEVHAERSNVKPASVDIGFTFQTQQADNQILVNDGETAVIGGLTVTSVTVTKSGIPFLVDLPIIGKLFGFSSQTETRRDLLILVTPHIIDDLVTPNTGK